MRQHIYVDFSNVFAEARHLSAVFCGVAKDVDDACDQKRAAHWRCDFAKLIEAISYDKPATAFLITSAPFRDAHLAEWAGFEVLTYPRGYRQREKCVDTHFAIRVVNDALTKLDPKKDQIVLVTGDLDQLPTAQFLRAKGFTVKITFWSHAAHALRNEANVFESLNPHWDLITLEGPKAKKL
jgi:uncharacterized LabA/DUF88 family protein